MVNGMKFTDFIRPNAIIISLKSTKKEDVIREMVKALQEADGVPEDELESVIEAVMKREELGSTGIGHGVAVPHAKHASVESLAGLVAVSADCVDFDSLDREPVQLFFMIVSPVDRPGEHLRALEHITRKLKDDSFVRSLKQARSPEEAYGALQEADDKPSEA